mgnify:CR=1 FL=1
MTATLERRESASIWVTSATGSPALKTVCISDGSILLSPLLFILTESHSCNGFYHLTHSPLLFILTESHSLSISKEQLPLTPLLMQQAWPQHSKGVTLYRATICSACRPHLWRPRPSPLSSTDKSHIEGVSLALETAPSWPMLEIIWRPMFPSI